HAFLLHSVAGVSGVLAVVSDQNRGLLRGPKSGLTRMAGAVLHAVVAPGVGLEVRPHAARLGDWAVGKALTVDEDEAAQHLDRLLVRADPTLARHALVRAAKEHHPSWQGLVRIHARCEDELPCHAGGLHGR